MQEMESVVTKRVGNIVAFNKRGQMGLILKKTKTTKETTWYGKVLEVEQADSEYRILCVKHAKLSNKDWQSTNPNPIGFLPPDEVKTLLQGGTVPRI